MRVAVLVVLAALSPLSCQAPTDNRPNILLISIDTLRADHLGCYGREVAQTPNIDSLAAGGVVFDTAISPVPLTLPAHTTMLTGLIPPRHGVRLNTESRLLSSASTLPEFLLDHGYQTGAFVGAGPMARHGGLAQGFQVYDDVTEERDAKTVFDAAARWLDSTDPDAPVFAFVHLFDPHWPLNNALPGESESSYDGEIAYVDRQLGEFMSSLPDTTRWRNALTVIVSDHGEGLGEHGEPSHGLLTYDSTLRVPLILHHEGVLEPRRIPEPVGLVDLAPTLGSIVADDAFVESDGESLLPLLRGAEPQDRAFYFESMYGYLEFGWARLRGLRVGSLKYISAPTPELYDLRADPGETVNLHASRPDDAARLEEMLSDAGEGIWTRVEMNPEELERLASLGYVSARPATAPSDDGRKDPKDVVESFYRLANAVAMSDIGRFAEAYPLFESLQSEFETSPHFYAKFGNVAAGLERWETAARLYERVVALDEANQTALENVGVTRLKTRDFERSHRAFSRLLEVNPDHVNAHYAIGFIDIWTYGNYASGMEHWSRLLELDPEHEKARQIRSVLDAYAEGGWTLDSLREKFRL